ncbi:MAG: urease accessory protein [Bacteroidota bacterium]
MDVLIPFLLAGGIGLAHAFEADHLLAVGSIVSKRRNVWAAARDGVFWGLGHTTTILVIGLLLIVGRATFMEGWFGYFEAAVGVMLIGLGIWRLAVYWRTGSALGHTHDAEGHHKEGRHPHTMAYSVGLVHGLAGSGALVLLVMTEIASVWQSMVYLALFGLGSAVGMLAAAGILSLPVTKRLRAVPFAEAALVITVAVLCIGYGGFVVYENLLA